MLLHVLYTVCIFLFVMIITFVSAYRTSLLCTKVSTLLQLASMFHWPTMMRLVCCPDLCHCPMETPDRVNLPKIELQLESFFMGQVTQVNKNIIGGH